MIQIFKVLILFSISLSAKEIKPWWPNKCGDIDTLISSFDTIITKYECKKNGKKILSTKRNGYYDGLYVAWDKDGNIIERVKYYKNEFDDTIEAWDSTGFLISKRYYEKGVPIGYHKDYYSKNRPKEFTHYNDSGEKHGLCETWFENGNRKDSVVYNNGKIVEGRYYFRNGKLRYTAKLKNGDIVKAVYFSPDGEKTGEIINGNGTVLIYDVDGISPSEFKCKDGKWVD